MDCASAKSRMEALASRALPESERALVEQHLAMCEGCRLELDLVRAVGSGKGTEGTPQSDWTFDRIFGAEDGADAAAAPPAESAQSGQADDPVQSGPLDHSGEPAESAPAGPALSWDFEPADVKPKLAPPEKSLSLAEEALTRHKDADRKKGSTLRLVLWGAGGVAGAALLGFSAWIALNGDTAPEEVGSHAAAPRQLPAAHTAPAQAPESAPPEPADAPTPPQGLPLGSSGVALGTPSAVAPAAPATRDTLLRASSAAAPSPLPAASALGPAVQPKPRGARTRNAPPPATTQPPPRTSASAPKAEPSTPKAAAPAPPGTGASAAEPPSSAREEVIVPARLLPAPAGDAAPEPAPPPEGRNSAFTPPPAPAAHIAPPPLLAPDDAVAKSAPANQAGAAQPALANSEPAKPIDRLHLATAQAEEQSDLATLRKLKVSWKGFMQKMGVGPDRSRARREFASCLWAIQSLTGRVQDQREALAAYRDYLLSAPAGGADSESVSRLRQLEDALSERR